MLCLWEPREEHMTTMEDLGHCLVVCVDMWASSSSWPSSTESWQLPAVDQHNSQVEQALTEAASASGMHGEVRRSASLGDGRLYVFPEVIAEQAVAFVERLLWHFPFDWDARPIRTSVGVAEGSVALSPDEGLRGRPVDIAARLATVAGPDQALLESKAVDAFRSHRKKTEMSPTADYVRLPGGGSSWSWPMVQVHELHREDAVAVGIRNPQASTEQALLLRTLAYEAVAGYRTVHVDYEQAFALLEEGRRHRPEDLRSLGNALAALTNTRSKVRLFVDIFDGKGQHSRGPKTQPLDEMARLPAVATNLARLRSALEALESEQARHVEGGMPNRRSPLCSTDQRVLDKATATVQDQLAVVADVPHVVVDTITDVLGDGDKDDKRRVDALPAYVVAP